MAQFFRIADTDGVSHIINLEHVIQFIEAPSKDNIGSIEASVVILTDNQEIRVEAGAASTALASVFEEHKR
jgi:hypothetical protein